MKKFLVGVVRFFLLNLLIILALNASIKYMVSDIIDNSGLDEQINNAVNKYFEKNNVTVVSKEQVRNLIDQILASALENDSDNVSDLLVEVINNNRDKLRAYGVSDREIDNVIYEIEANITSSTNGVKLSDKQKLGLVVYRVVSSIEFRNWVIICIVICYLLLSTLNSYDSYKDIGVTLIVAGIMIKVGCIIVNKLLNSEGFSEKLKGLKINFSYLDKYIYVYIGAGILLLIGHHFYKLLLKEKEALD